MFSQILGPEQPLLLRSDRREQNRSRLRHRHRGPHAGQFQQNSATRRIIVRAVVDLVPRQAGVDSQMVVVRRVQYRLFAEQGIRTRQHRQNIS